MPGRLTTVIDAALAEIEEYKRVDVHEPLPDVAIGAELASDLRLLLAELLENATNFTPPGSTVEVSATHERETSFAADATITIVDHGLGMSPARMEEENRRLVERERLDIAPTRVLGLFVVGRLARRHGLTVRLEPTPGRGVTATVRVPARWLTPASAPSGPGSLGVVPPLAAAAIETAARSGPFPWLSRRSGTEAPVSGVPVSAAPVTAVPIIGVPVGAAPVRRPPVAPATPPAAVPPRSERIRPIRRVARDPEAERASLDAYASGVARAGGVPDSESEPVTEPVTDSHPDLAGRTLEDTPADPTPDAERAEPTLVERHQ
jgi:hypothetical protein